MSAWSWDGLPYVVKFNFMYLTEVFVRPTHRLDAFGPQICPLFLNDHLARRIGAVA